MAKFIEIEGTTNWNNWVSPKDQKVEKIVVNEDDIVRVSSDKAGLALLLMKSPDRWEKPFLFHSVNTYQSIVSALGDSIRNVEKADDGTLSDYSPYDESTI